MVTRATLVSLSMQVTRVGASERPAPLEGGHPGSRRAGGPRSTPACPVSVSVQRGACAEVPWPWTSETPAFPQGRRSESRAPAAFCRLRRGWRERSRRCPVILAFGADRLQRAAAARQGGPVGGAVGGRSQKLLDTSTINNSAVLGFEVDTPRLINKRSLASTQLIGARRAFR